MQVLHVPSHVRPDKLEADRTVAAMCGHPCRQGQESNLSKMEMWWLIGSAPEYWGRGPGFESGMSPTMILMRCRITV